MITIAYTDFLVKVIFTTVLLKFIPVVCSVVCLVIDRFIDGFVIFMRKTIYKDSQIYKEMDEGNFVTVALGTLLNGVQNVMNKTVWRSLPRMTDYRHKFALKYASFKENASFIGRSLSYGLILFCGGLCAILIYLLLAAFA